MENMGNGNKFRKDNILVSITVSISLLILSIFLYWDTMSISDWIKSLFISILFSAFCYALYKIYKIKNIDYHFQIFISSVLAFFFVYLLNLIILIKIPHYIIISSLFGAYFGSYIKKYQGKQLSFIKLFLLVISLIVSYNVLFFVFDDRLAGMSTSERKIKHYLVIEKGYSPNEIKDYYVSTFNLRINANVPFTEVPAINYTYSFANVRFADEMDSNYVYLIEKDSVKQIKIQNFNTKDSLYKHIESDDVKINK